MAAVMGQEELWLRTAGWVEGLEPGSKVMGTCTGCQR